MVKCICMNCGKITEQNLKYASGLCSNCGNDNIGFSSIVREEEPELYKWLTSKKKDKGIRPITRAIKISVYENQGIWHVEYRKQYDRLDRICETFCVCGKIASGFHVDRCQKFRRHVVENTLKALTDSNKG